MNIKNKRNSLLIKQNNLCKLCNSYIGLNKCSLIRHQNKPIVVCKVCIAAADKFTGKKVNGRHEIKIALYKKDQKCYYCRCRMFLTINKPNSITIDHLTPRCRGGTNELPNLVACCRRCNEEKGKMMELEYFYYLKEKAIKMKLQEFNNEIANGSVLVDFYSDNCGPCKRLSPILDKLKDKIKILKIDVYEAEDVASQYSISAVPTLIFFKNGKQVDKVIGLPKESDIVAKINSLS